MTTKENFSQELLKDAKRIFIDADSYNDEEKIVGFYRLLNAICETETLKPKSASLLKLESALSKLDKKHSEVIIFRFIGNYTQIKCATLLGCSKQTICQRQNKALKLLRGYSKDFLIHKHYDFFKRRKKFISAVKTKKPSTEDILIEDLNLSTRTFNALKRANIKTASQMFFLTDKKLLKIPNIGVKCVDEIHKVKHQLLSGKK